MFFWYFKQTNMYLIGFYLHQTKKIYDLNLTKSLSKFSELYIKQAKIKANNKLHFFTIIYGLRCNKKQKCNFTFKFSHICVTVYLNNKVLRKFTNYFC